VHWAKIKELLGQHKVTGGWFCGSFCSIGADAVRLVDFVLAVAGRCVARVRSYWPSPNVATGVSLPL
jgi:hypothetical protein